MKHKRSGICLLAISIVAMILVGCTPPYVASWWGAVEVGAGPVSVRLAPGDLFVCPDQSGFPFGITIHHGPGKHTTGWSIMSECGTLDIRGGW